MIALVCVGLGAMLVIFALGLIYLPLAILIGGAALIAVGLFGVETDGK